MHCRAHGMHSDRISIFIATFTMNLFRIADPRLWTKPVPGKSGNGNEGSQEYAAAVVEWSGRIDDRRREIMGAIATKFNYDPQVIENFDVRDHAHRENYLYFLTLSMTFLYRRFSFFCTQLILRKRAKGGPIRLSMYGTGADAGVRPMSPPPRHGDLSDHDSDLEEQARGGDAFDHDDGDDDDDDQMMSPSSSSSFSSSSKQAPSSALTGSAAKKLEYHRPKPAAAESRSERKQRQQREAAQAEVHK